MGIDCLKRANATQNVMSGTLKYMSGQKTSILLICQNRLSGQQSTTSLLHSETDYEALDLESFPENINFDPKIDLSYYNSDISYYVNEYDES